MTDNEIIKALECCSNESTLNCRNCPYERACNMGKSDMQRDALNLINRQKAEIERLQKRIVNWREDMDYRPEKVRTDAIREFAERLSERAPHITEERFFILRDEIDNLVKEMTEETPC